MVLQEEIPPNEKELHHHSDKVERVYPKEKVSGNDRGLSKTTGCH
jgi:hypothetical protein